MDYTYILISEKDGNRYIGSTNNLTKRLEEHNKGYVLSTKSRRPLTLYAYRECETIKEASVWEKKYKNSHGQLERDIKNGKIKLVIQ